MVLMRAHGIAEPLRFSAALTDGRRLYIVRHASDDAPPTLYVKQGARGSIVASEPLAGGDAGWRALGNGETLTLTHDDTALREAHHEPAVMA
jgi:predicted glutamine amidotransferase